VRNRVLRPCGRGLGTNLEEVSVFDLSTLKTDKKLEEDGAWVEISQGFSIKVCRMGSKRHTKALERLRMPYKNWRELPDEKARELTIKALAEGVLIDWKGLRLDGKELPYSVDNCVQVLSEIGEFANMVIQAASNFTTFKEETLKGEEKN